MPPPPPAASRLQRGARATCVLKPSNIEAIVCHRVRKGREEYLVRWKPDKTKPIRAGAVCSWHDLNELWRCLHLIQDYAESRARSKLSVDRQQSTSLKRKSPGADVTIARDQSTGILTPQASTSTNLSRSVSVVSISSDEESEDNVTVWNGVLERKDGWIIAKPSARARNIDATSLPTLEMRRSAAATPIKEAHRAIRKAFETKLQKLPRVYLENKVDSTTPSLSFTFIKKYVLGEGVSAQDLGAFVGCQKPCKPNMGQHVGCEYTTKCDCLEYAAVDEKALERTDQARYLTYKSQLAEQEAGGDFVQLLGLPKRFPYHKKKSNDDRHPQTLQPFYRESRHPIYECNQNCNCGPVCKSRVVQKGRRVPLTIFKTPNHRGWGVKCNEDLIQGEFVDTYLGEVITSAECDAREESSSSSPDKASYLYALDKWSEELGGDQHCYVVDGQHMGGPTRFINHSCEPNLRQFTVSYNKHDLQLYDLAFFAIEDIPRGTELTFDYMDRDEVEEEDARERRRQLEADPANAGKPRCGCGAGKCRGFLWV